MKQIHGEMINAPVTASSVGDNIIVASLSAGYIYAFRIIGDLSAAGTMTIKAGARTLGTFALDAGQGITLGEAGNENSEPAFICFPGEGLILNLSAGTFNGNVYYATRT